MRSNINLSVLSVAGRHSYQLGGCQIRHNQWVFDHLRPICKIWHFSFKPRKCKKVCNLQLIRSVLSGQVAGCALVKKVCNLTSHSHLWLPDNSLGQFQQQTSLLRSLENPSDERSPQEISRARRPSHDTRKTVHQGVWKRKHKRGQNVIRVQCW